MRYKIRGQEIRSENAAQPVGTGCHWVLDHIRSLPPNAAVLDYGCGKMRYTLPLAKRVRTVVAVDSTWQTSRVQKIGKHHTSLVDYAKEHLENVKVFADTAQAWQRRKYDFILLANVLSAVPIRKKRVEILRTLKMLLRPRGTILVLNQFRDPYFESYRAMPNARVYLALQRYVRSTLFRSGGNASI